MCISHVSEIQPLYKTEIKKTLQTKEKLHQDVLAVFTYQTKVFFNFLARCQEAFYNSASYKILFHTTQPAHLITALAVLTISYLLFSKNTESEVSPIYSLVYLAAFSVHFGAQIWMTFVSGLALYFSLPRHIFGNVQQVLFPKYFLLNAALSLTTLVLFLKTKNSQIWATEIAVQAGAISLCFLTELMIRLYLTPPLLDLIIKKHKIEKEAGVGMEVGKLNPGKLKNSLKYIQLHKKFRRVHMSIAIGNVTSMACTVIHLYYLSQKIRFL